MLDYTAYIDAPELVDVCRNCKFPDCKGICLNYKNAYRALNGLPPIAYEKNGQSMENKTDRKQNRLYEANGEAHTLKDWSKITGISYATLYMRINKRGYTTEEAITRKDRRKARRSHVVLQIGDERGTVHEWAEKADVAATTIYNRLARGKSDYEAVFGGIKDGLK